MKRKMVAGILFVIVVLGVILFPMLMRTDYPEEKLVDVGTESSNFVEKSENSENKDGQIDEEMNMRSDETLIIPTENEAISQNETAEKDKLVPTIVAVVKDENGKESVILEGLDGEQAVIQFGVVDSEEESEFSANEANQYEVGIKNDENNEEEYSDPPRETLTHIVKSSGSDMATTLSEYEEMTGEEQMLFYYSFSNADAFLEWYNTAKTKHEESINKVYFGEDGISDSND